MNHIIEKDEIYKSIVKEFKINDLVLERMKKEIYKLVNARIDICELLKIEIITKENIDICLYVKENKIISNIKVNETSLKSYEVKQIEFIENIKDLKQKIKGLKLQISELEISIREEQQESRKLRENLNIFISREKFKTIKKILFKKYRNIFLKYSNELIIEKKILECNKRKEEIRQQEENLNDIIKRYVKKITSAKKSLAEVKKNIINMVKSIELSRIKLQAIRNYKEIENKFDAMVLFNC